MNDKILNQSASIYYMTVDTEGQYKGANKLFLDRFQCHALETGDLKVEDTIFPEDLPKVNATFTEAMAHKGVHQPVVIRKPVEGELIYTQWEFVNYPEDAETIHCVGYDVSLISKMNILLDKVSNEYAHQIRGPIARLLGLISLFYENPQDEKALKHLLRVSEELDDLLKSAILNTDKREGKESE